jgi:hypothetical protein
MYRLGDEEDAEGDRWCQRSKQLRNALYPAAAACILAYIRFCGINPTAVPAAQYNSHSQDTHPAVKLAALSL